jgi:AcrR family transcriptional regulator
MTEQIDPPAPSRSPLSRQRVLSAALSLADSGGIAALSMRRLGQKLGVEAMSLYNHVANKDDLLNGLVELVNQEIELPSGAADWQAALRASALSAHAALLRHPWACGLIMSPAGACPARLRWMDATLGCLRQAGCSVELTHYAYHAVDSHITGFTLWLTQLPALGEELNGVAADFLTTLAIDEHPYLAEHVQHHLTGVSPDDKGTFEFGLDLLLDGIARMRAAA